MLLAAQDQALPTRWRRKHIEKSADSSLCRMCGEMDETIMHVVSECRMLAQKEYKARHDKVASIVHWSLCKKFQLQHSEKWYDHRAEKVLENKEVKLLWDFNVQTDKEIHARRPDIILVDKEKGKTWVIDIAVCGDGRVEQKEREKIEKYQELAEEIRKIWRTSAVVVPIVIGALGGIAKLKKYTKQLGIELERDRLQMTALLETARILRKTLNIPE